MKVAVMLRIPAVQLRRSGRSRPPYAEEKGFRIFVRKKEQIIEKQLNTGMSSLKKRRRFPEISFHNTKSSFFAVRRDEAIIFDANSLTWDPYVKL